MADKICFLVVIIVSYLIGSMNASVVISKILGDDIRNHGSGNAGATNMLRTYGKGAALIVLLVDVLKGVLAVLIAKFAFAGMPLYQYISGGGAILGHNFPLYFGFKGGKGVLTSIAVLITLNWWIGLVALVSALLIMAVTRYVSLGSMLGAVIAAVSPTRTAL